ncbi:hypothetical protein BMI88_08120 [Thioclava sp. F36-6]|nr:hypothetical protein BMI88_08120 [Thioclava sp. F36-6]
MELARLIRAAEMDTMIGRSEPYEERWFTVVEGGECLGACAIAFLGGKERIIGTQLFDGDFEGRIEFDRLNGHEILEGIAGKSLTGADLLEEQIEIGIFVEFLLEMGVSPELYARIAALPLGASLAISNEVSEELRVSTSRVSQRPWRLDELGYGLIARTGPREDTDSLWAFCANDGFHLARAFSNVDAEGAPCDQDTCYSASDVMFQDAQIEIGDRHFPIEFLGLRVGGIPGVEVLVDSLVPREALETLPTAKSISLNLNTVSRLTLDRARVFKWRWGEEFDPRLIKLALNNCVQ